MTGTTVGRRYANGIAPDNATGQRATETSAVSSPLISDAND